MSEAAPLTVLIVAVLVLLLVLLFREEIRGLIPHLRNARTVFGEVSFGEDVGRTLAHSARSGTSEDQPAEPAAEAAPGRSQAAGAPVAPDELDRLELDLRRRFDALRRRAHAAPADAVVEAREAVWAQGKRAQEARNPGLTVGPAYDMRAMASALPGAGVEGDLRELERLYRAARADASAVDGLGAAAYVELAESIALRFLLAGHAPR